MFKVSWKSFLLSLSKIFGGKPVEQKPIQEEVGVPTGKPKDPLTKVPEQPKEEPKPTPITKETPEQFLRKALVDRNLTFVGKVKESAGSNRDNGTIDEINEWIGSGGKSGFPYCIAAQQFNANEICKKFKLKNPIKKTASTQKFIQWVKENKPQYLRKKGKDWGKMGDWVSFIHANNPGNGHEAMLTADQKSRDEFPTVEWNTSKAGSRNGDGVYELVRTEGDNKGDLEFQAFIDVAQWILDENPEFAKNGFKP